TFNVQRDIPGAFVDVATFLPLERFTGIRNQIQHLDRASSSLISIFTDAFECHAENGAGHLVWIRDDRQLQVDVLKQLTWYYVILRPGLATQQAGQEKIIELLFTHFLGVIGDKKKDPLLPPGFRGLFHPDGPSNQPHRARLAADIVSGLTEQEAVMLFRRLTGHSSGSLLDWLPT
ncbi:MAG: hypothetical protein HY317_06230, partial [Acidobacteria bacterium]|nr:hypothetical protein [Acidobacteriota bacterium]